jgi:hypothetical protein
MIPRSARILEQSTPNERPFMKFFSLGTERTHRRGKLDKPSRATLESSTKPMPVPHQIHTYTELRQQIHDDLRIQHPEWVQPNGESSKCDSYEARLMELLHLDPFSQENPNAGPRSQLMRKNQTLYLISSG